MILMNNENRWIKQIQRHGNKDAANKLITKYYKEMFAYVYKQTLNRELALDFTQEIFIVVLRSIQNYDGKKASFRTWLYKLASNRLVDFYRSKTYKQINRTESIEDYDIEDEDDMTVSLEYKEEYEKVTSIINELPADIQQIIRLKLFGDYTFSEIAATEEIPESTVKTKYYAALKKIRKKMEVHNG